MRIGEKQQYHPNLKSATKVDNSNTNNNNRTLLVEPCFPGKTYLVLKMFSRLPDRDIFKFTKSLSELYSISEIKINEISEEIKHLNEYKIAIIVFDVILGLSNSRYIDQFFIGGTHNRFDFFHLSQSYFDLPKRTIRNFRNKVFLFIQTLRDLKKYI